MTRRDLTNESGAFVPTETEALGRIEHAEEMRRWKAENPLPLKSPTAMREDALRRADKGRNKAVDSLREFLERGAVGTEISQNANRRRLDSAVGTGRTETRVPVEAKPQEGSLKKARQAWACMTALARYMDLEIVDIAFKVKGDPYRYSAGIIVKDGEGKA